MTEPRQISRVNWRFVDNAINEIANRAPEVDHIIGVGRGGLPGAVHLSHLLDVDMGVIHASYYEDGYQQSEAVNLSMISKPPGEGDTVLLFDDLVDSGETMERVEEKVRDSIGDLDIVTAVLFRKEGTEYEPDIHVAEADENEWLEFPWEYGNE